MKANDSIIVAYAESLKLDDYKWLQLIPNFFFAFCWIFLSLETNPI